MDEHDFTSCYNFSFLFQAAALAQQSIKKLVPMFDRVLVLRAEAVTRTKGGIMIPEKSQGKVLHGTVVAVGPGSRNTVRIQFFYYSYFMVSLIL